MSRLPKYKYSLTDTDMKAIVHVFRIFEIRLRCGVMREEVHAEMQKLNEPSNRRIFLESHGCDEYAWT